MCEAGNFGLQGEGRHDVLLGVHLQGVGVKGKAERTARDLGGSHDHCRIHWKRSIHAFFAKGQVLGIVQAQASQKLDGQVLVELAEQSGSCSDFSAAAIDRCRSSCIQVDDVQTGQLGSAIVETADCLWSAEDRIGQMLSGRMNMGIVPFPTEWALEDLFATLERVDALDPIPNDVHRCCFAQLPNKYVLPWSR